MVTELEILMRLFLAAILGALVGYERESAHKAAGLRTHMIVCLGSALMTLVSAYAFGEGDPTRVASSIITGIGFLGAETIIVGKGSVSGLTSAASLWMVAGVGLAIGIGYYYATVFAVMLVVLILEMNRFFNIK